jgi:hypothetical protein
MWGVAYSLIIRCRAAISPIKRKSIIFSEAMHFGKILAFLEIRVFQHNLPGGDIQGSVQRHCVVIPITQKLADAPDKHSSRKSIG